MSRGAGMQHCAALLTLGCLALWMGCIHDVNRSSEHGDNAGTLPQVYLSIPDADFEELMEDPFADRERRGELVFVHHDRVDRRRCDVAIQGASSRHYPKKSFKFDLSGALDIRPYLPETMRRWCASESGHVILKGFAHDMSKMREYLSMYVTHRAGGKGPTAGFVEFYVNQEYYGLMVLMEKINQSYLRVQGSVGQLDLLKSLTWKGNMETREDPLAGIDVKYGSGEGYISTVAWLNAQERGYRDMLDRTTDSTLWGYALGCFLSGETDGFGKNYYYVHNPIQNTFEFIRWDGDATWGRNWHGEPIALTWEYCSRESALFGTLWDDIGWRREVGNRLQSLFDEGLREDLSAKLDWLQVLLADPVERDLAQWGDTVTSFMQEFTGHDSWPHYRSGGGRAVFEHDVDLIREFVYSLPQRTRDELGLD